MSTGDIVMGFVLLFGLCLAFYTLYSLSHPNFRMKNLIPKVSFPKRKPIPKDKRDPVFDILARSDEEQHNQEAHPLNTELNEDWLRKNYYDSIRRESMMLQQMSQKRQNKIFRKI